MLSHKFMSTILRMYFFIFIMSDFIGTAFICNKDVVNVPVFEPDGRSRHNGIGVSRSSLILCSSLPKSIIRYLAIDSNYTMQAFCAEGAILQSADIVLQGYLTLNWHIYINITFISI